MNTNSRHIPRLRRSEQGLTLVEIMISVAAVGILVVSLYTAFSQGFAIIQTARENLRATQILQEKMETMRVYNWDQITTPGFIPSKFIEPFYAVGDNDNGGFNYTGQITITNVFPLGGVSYANDMRWVVAEVQWTSGSSVRRREMRTLVSEFGLHAYVY